MRITCPACAAFSIVCITRARSTQMASFPCDMIHQDRRTYQERLVQLQSMLEREVAEFRPLGVSTDLVQRSRVNCLENVYEMCLMHRLTPNCVFLAVRLLDLYCASVSILCTRDLVIAAIASIRLACAYNCFNKSIVSLFISQIC